MKKNKFYKIGSLFILLFSTTMSQARNEGDVVPQETMTFDFYLNRVGKQNLEFLANRLNVNIADAERIAAKVMPDPSLDFEAGKETFSLGLSYSLELGKRTSRVRLAKTQLEYEKLALEQNFHELRAQAAELFLDAILQKELLTVKDSSYSYMVRLQQSDSMRYQAGEITEIDARQSRIEAIGLLNDVYDQQAAYHSALIDLNQFMGISTDTLYFPQGDWNHLEYDFSLVDLLKYGLQNRVDLMAATKNVEVSRRAYKMARADRRPDIDLSLSYERDWNKFLPEARYMTAGISIPLSFSMMNKGSLKSARFQIDQAVLMRENLNLQVQSEIRQAWFAFEAEKKKVAQYQTGVLEEAQKVMDGMAFKYKRGEASIQDVLLAQRTFNEVRQDYLETMKGFVSALVQLEKSCGIWDIHF